MDTPKFFTMKEAASLLRVSPITVRRRIADRTIAAIRIGKRILIPASYIESLEFSLQTPSQCNQGGNNEQPET
jgi:excisionase family DNA binding protein